MGNYNKIDGLLEVPLPGEKCQVCEGTGKVSVAEGEETKEQQCGQCSGTGEVGPKKSIKLRNRIRNKIKAEFEDWLEYHARRRVFDMRTKFTAEEFAEMIKSVTRECAAYTFAWGGEAWESSIKQLPGTVTMIKLLIDDADRLTREDNVEYRGQNVTETKVMEWMNDKVVGPMLAAVFHSIMDASPNFLSPPVRGIDD